MGNKPSKIDFNRFPDEICFQIFQYLPFQDRVRCARVSKRFRQISNFSISLVKCLDLEEDIFQKLTPTSLSKIVNLCYRNLEKVKVRDWTLGIRSHIDSVKILTQFSCPRLISIENITADISERDLENLLRNNRNLKNLICTYGYAPIRLPNSVICNNLQSLICLANQSTFDSLRCRCPNLRRLEVKLTSTVFCSETIDDFFSTCPNLETFVCSDPHNMIGFIFELLKHFWRLTSMRRLVVDKRYDNSNIDDLLTKSSDSFPRLEILQLVGLARDQNFKCLAKLRNLRKLALIRVSAGFFDQAWRDLAQPLSVCENLEEIQLSVVYHQTTVIRLIGCFPRLRFLFLNLILNLDTVEKAVEFVESLGSICRGNLTIRIRRQKNFELFESKIVEAVLEKVKNIHGHEIKFEQGNYVSYCGVK